MICGAKIGETLRTKKLDQDDVLMSKRHTLCAQEIFSSVFAK